jgi:hypothetical protein
MDYCLPKTDYALGGSSEPIRGMCLVKKRGTTRGGTPARRTQRVNPGSGARCARRASDGTGPRSGTATGAFSVWPRARWIRP